ELQFSLPFGIATALVHGDASPDRFVLASLDDARIRTLLGRVVGVRDAALDARYPRAWPTWVRVFRPGRPPLEARIEHPLGDPENFPASVALRAKFQTLAARTLPAGQIAKLDRTLDSFRTLPRAVAVLAAAVPTVT